MARGTIINRELKDGTKKYDAVIRLNGKQVWKSFGRKKAAEEYLDSHSTEVRDGTFREIRKGTFAQYAEHWRATHAITPKLKATTLNTYICILEKHLLPYFGRYGMQAISSAEVNAFAAKLYEKKLSDKTITNILNLLYWFFQKAKADKYVRASPMLDGVDKPKITKAGKGRALRPVEITVLLASAGDALTRLIIMVALLTGMRRAEIFGLRWEDVDFRENVIRVRQALCWLHGTHIRPAEGESFIFTKPKSEDSIRKIDLSPALKKELLLRYLGSQKTGLVFSTPEGRPLAPNAFAQKQFQPAVKAAGLGHVRFHDLRHTFGSLKLEQGENLVYVSKQMGHSKPSITADVYAHQLKEQRPEAAAKTDALLFPVAEPGAAVG